MVPAPETLSESVASLLEFARLGEPSGTYLLVSHEARFNNPLVSGELRSIASLELPAGVVAAAERCVALSQGPALYFPVPLARALETGVEWEAAAWRFHYDMVVVDREQNWSWRGAPVAERTRKFFLDHMTWEAEISRFVFEYRVHDQWWDKSYLDAQVTPFLAHRLEVLELGPPARVRAHLTSGQRPLVDLDSFRLDERERLLVTTNSCGEVLISDNERFRVLRRTSEDLSGFEFAGAMRRLRWPE